MNNEQRVQQEQAMQTAEKIRAYELPTALDRFCGKIDVLSLDCFDTILWRKVANPMDVFFALQSKPTFQSSGLNAALRMHSESQARNVAMLYNNVFDAKLADIYRAAQPNATATEIESLCEEELAVEMELCYIIPPIIALIKEAKRRGLKVIIVSDTYFDESRLRRLLSHAMPEDMLKLVDQIFCSSDYGKTKTSGLFTDVLNKLKVSSDKILHIGDNISADYLYARQHKINALHLLQHDDAISEIIRLQDTTSKMLDPNVRASKAMVSPFRGILGQHSFSGEKPENLIGYASLGPIMYAFAKFICEEIKELKDAGKKLKTVFLMRDAHLPYLACEALAGEAVGKKVRISRFASYASSFTSQEDIDNYLIEIGKTNRYQDVGRQLLLPDKVLAPLLKVIERHPSPYNEFLKTIRRKDIVKIILQKSAEYRERLFKHLEKEVDLKSGDTLLLVDLGYSGTAQRRLTPVLKQKNIDVVGCYLLSLRVPSWQGPRKGLIDSSWCDDKALHTVVFYITLLEQLCTSNEHSVIDYDKEGNAIYSDVVMSDEQHAKLLRIQNESIKFVKDAKDYFVAANTNISRDILRQISLVELGRMIFLPTEIEINYLKTFQAEMNLGTNDVLRVFDAEQGLIGLRRRGMFYMERPSKSTRTNYPAELRSAAIELSLSLMAQHRYGLDLKMKDMSVRREQLSIVFTQGTETFKTSVDAVATHDGFFAVWLPSNLNVSILFGEKYEWIQIESAELIHREAFVNQEESQSTTEAWSALSSTHMKKKSGNLFEIENKNAAITLTPNHLTNSIDLIFRLVFRPIVKQTSATTNTELMT